MSGEKNNFNGVDRELAARLYPGSFGQLILLAVVIFSTSLASEHPLTALLCGGLIVVANLVRIRLGFSREKYIARASTWRNSYSAATILTGAAWGALTSFVIFHYELTSLPTLYCFLNLCGIAAAGTTALSPRPAAARFFLGALLFPPVIELALIFPATGLPIAALTLAYFGFLAAQASFQGRSLAAAQEATDQYHAIAENSGEGILIHQEGKITEVNAAGARIFGRRPAEMLGQGLGSIVDAANLARAYEQSAPHSGRVVMLEGTRADGSLFPMEICAIDCTWRGKAARAVRFRDLTESQRVARLLEEAKDAAEKEVALRTAELRALTSTLRESESRLEAVIEQSPLPNFLLRADGSVAQVNGAAKVLWGLRTEEATKQFLLSYNVGRDPNWQEQGLLDMLADAWRGKSAFLPSALYEPVRIGARGEAFWLEAFVAPVKRADGTVSELTLTLRDTTQRRRSEAERASLEIREKSAREASRLKSEFLANMSHEIRTPMNGVLGMVDILLGTPLSQEQRDYSETIRRSGEGLLTLINDILDFSKIEAGKLEFEHIDFSLNEKLADIERAFNVLASGKDILFIVERGAGLPDFVRGDPGRVAQVLNNLLGNAIKFTSRGKVILRVSGGGPAPGGRELLRIEVDDSGPGIAPEAQARLFEPFSQADASTTRKFGGTGLGLSITKRLVENMHGRIGVESAAGKGARFWAEIALTPGVKAAPALAESKGPCALQAGARILLAEDNLINQKIAARMLEGLGLSVAVAGTGKEALAALSREPFDLVLMDVQMPEMDGLEAARALRADRGALNAEVPIVALTANALKGDDQVCFDAGMNDYLTKPITADRLRAMLATWLPATEAGRAPPKAS